MAEKSPAFDDLRHWRRHHAFPEGILIDGDIPLRLAGNGVAENAIPDMLRCETLRTALRQWP